MLGRAVYYSVTWLPRNRVKRRKFCVERHSLFSTNCNIAVWLVERRFATVNVPLVVFVVGVELIVTISAAMTTTVSAKYYPTKAYASDVSILDSTL